MTTKDKKWREKWYKMRVARLMAYWRQGRNEVPSKNKRKKKT